MEKNNARKTVNNKSEKIPVIGDVKNEKHKKR